VIILNLLADLDEGLEECFVITVVVALAKDLKEWDISINSENIWAVNDFFLNGSSVLSE